MTRVKDAQGVVTKPVKVMVVYGTRQEIIRMAPVVRELRNRPREERLEVSLVEAARRIVDPMDLALMRVDCQDVSPSTSKQ